MSLFDPSEVEVAPEVSEPAFRPTGRRWGRDVAAVALAGAVVLTTWVVGIAVRDSVRSARRARCTIQLKELGLALHEYHNEHGHFPAPAIVNRDGRPLLSWRVAVLPYLGHRSLYERFRLDEPWDSPHNLALLPEMPAELACPGGPSRSAGKTGYLVVVGPETHPTSVNTPFEPRRGVDLREITDGTSNTLLVMETNRPVEWTRPDDLRWERGGPPPALASPHLGGANVILADGSTRFLRATLERAVLVAILTINGGEVTSAG